jgi:ATP-dependent RNA circularization protein (DNA/RNA ligase family)
MNEPAVAFPVTPHLVRPDRGFTREDKVVNETVRATLLSRPIFVEEKIDGANVGIHLGEDGGLVAFNRNTRIGPGAHPQFAPFKAWLAERRSSLTVALTRGLVLFGEWCYARHTIVYDSLPDYFLLFDVWDRHADRFLGLAARDEWARQLGLATVPLLWQGVVGDRTRLETLASRSRFGPDSAEGLYLRREVEGRLLYRAKWVRTGFLQPGAVHWSGKSLVRNFLARQIRRASGGHRR